MNREDQIKKDIDELYKEREIIRSRKTLKCGSCGKRSQISKWIVIDNFYYVRPYSCSGGDYWSHMDDYNLVCPKCEAVGRTYLESWIAGCKKENKELSQHFLYNDTTDSDLALFTFVREHHKYFGEHLQSHDEGKDVIKLRAIKKKTEENRRNSELY